MTAPDPGLTDLIAAHKIQLFGVDGPHYQAETEYDGCLCGWQGAEEGHPAHVALVVEQHTNGRHEWPKTTPTGHTYERPTTYDELNGITADMAQGEIEGWEKTELPPEPTWPMVTLAQREIYRQSVRIAELEADSANWKSRYNGAVRVIEAGTANWTATILDRDDWKVRAEKAEATIARVEALADSSSGRIVGRDGATGVPLFSLRAALEGEQQ